MKRHVVLVGKPQNRMYLTVCAKERPGLETLAALRNVAKAAKEYLARLESEK